jgi:hypothetical protein
MEVKSSIKVILSSNDALCTKLSKMLDNSDRKSLDCIHVAAKC